MDNIFTNGLRIQIVPDIKRQRRTHRKRRINKKWAKRYGFYYQQYLKDGDIVMTPDALLMNQKTYSALKLKLELEGKLNETT